MLITFVELRRNPGLILEALERNEAITITRRGKDIARITPTRRKLSLDELKNHPSFGAWKDDRETRNSAGYVRKIRRGRYS